MNVYVTSTGLEAIAPNMHTKENVIPNVKDALDPTLQIAWNVLNMPCGLVMDAPVSYTGKVLTAPSKSIVVIVIQNV